MSVEPVAPPGPVCSILLGASTNGSQALDISAVKIEERVGLV